MLIIQTWYPSILAKLVGSRSPFACLGQFGFGRVRGIAPVAVQNEQVGGISGLWLHE